MIVFGGPRARNTPCMEGGRRRWPWGGWRIRGGTAVPPERRSLRSSDGIDEAAIGGDPDVAEPGGGQEIARDFGDLGDPFDRDPGRPG
jgi:hypothetical protein